MFNATLGGTPLTVPNEIFHLLIHSSDRSNKCIFPLLERGQFSDNNKEDDP